ncbi:MAG TPA: response regulator receiver protein, partial [Rubrivivax sp.]|nr:response regulator receiver protein [Rubrivivax sp.]
MTSAVILIGNAGASGLAAQLTADLAAAGVDVLGSAQLSNLLHETIRLAPDVLVGLEPQPDESLFQALQAMQTHSPRAVLLFTDSADGGFIERAV